MSLITLSIIAGTVLTVIVLLLSLLTLKQGYGYKHTIDPHPEEDENKKE